MDEFFRQRGMPQSRVDQCLNDPAGLNRLAEIQQTVAQAGVTGTPTFFINGQEAEGAGYWNNGNPAQSLEPRLRAAIGS
jgi:protein-disulfide isomerase